MEKLESKTLEFKWFDYVPEIGIFTFNKRNLSRMKSDDISLEEINKIGYHSAYQGAVTIGAAGLSLIGIIYAVAKIS